MTQYSIDFVKLNYDLEQAQEAQRQLDQAAGLYGEDAINSKWQSHYLSSPEWTSITHELLAGLLYGGNVVEHKTQAINTDVSQLTDIPINAKMALIICEADATTANMVRVIRYKQDGSNPTNSAGIAISNGGYFEIKGRNNLRNFRVKGIENGKTHTLQIEYYG